MDAILIAVGLFCVCCLFAAWRGSKQLQPPSDDTIRSMATILFWFVLIFLVLIANLAEILGLF